MDSFRNIPASSSESWKDNVPTASALPLLNNTIGDKREVLDTNSIYTWDGTSWIIIASPSGSAMAIDQLIGDVLATGPGVATATLKTVNLNVGSFGTSTSVPTIAVNGKGLITSVSNTSIQLNLDNLTDVSVPSTPSDGNLLVYESSTSLWKNKAPVFNDSIFRIQDNTDPTKQIAFEASSILTGQTRTLTAPNASGRIQIEGQPIGDVTPSSGTFTSLTEYNTYTSPTNFERAFLRWNTNRFEIGTDEAGLGQHRPIRLLQNGFTKIELNQQVYLWNEVNGRTKLISSSASNQTRDLAFPDASGTLSIEKYLPGGGDDYEIQSYNRFLNGSLSLDSYPSGGKWQQIAFSGSPNWANLRLCFAILNGKTLPQYLIGQETYVDPSSYYEVDYGWGLAPANYTDFINALFSDFDIQTQIYCKADLTWHSFYYTTDNFFFVFEETAFIDNGGGSNTIQSPTYFSLQTNGPVLADNFGASMNEMIPNYSQNIKMWTIL